MNKNSEAYVADEHIIEAGEALKDAVLDIHETVDIAYTSTMRIKSIIPYCIRLLEADGYKVINPVHDDSYSTITKFDDLVEYFYQRYSYLFPEKAVPTRNEKRDKQIISALIKSRQVANGLNRKEAIIECAEIIDVVLSNPNRFKLLFKIGLRMFGQGDMSWATDEAVGIINNKRTYELSSDMLRTIEEGNKAYKGPHGIMHLIEEKERKNGKEEKN